MPDDLANYLLEYAAYWQSEFGSARERITALGQRGLVRTFLGDPRFGWRLWAYWNPPDRLRVEELVRAGLDRVAKDAQDLAPDLVAALYLAARDRRRTAALVLLLLAGVLLVILALASS